MVEGQIATTTPIGSLVVKAHLLALAAVSPMGISLPPKLRSSSAALRRPSILRSPR